MWSLPNVVVAEVDLLQAVQLLLEELLLEELNKKGDVTNSKFLMDNVWTIKIGVHRKWHSMLIYSVFSVLPVSIECNDPMFLLLLPIFR